MIRQRNNNNNNHLNPPKPVAEIDLHGYTKSEAIQRLTVFLDEVSRQQQSKNRLASSNPKPCWVLVITGSGAHSPYGPVLRTAVEELLQKRQMQFVQQRGKGGFTVNANSGIVIFEPSQPTDSKILLTNAPAPGLSYASILEQHRDRVRAPPKDTKSEPLPAEVAATDAAIQESKLDALLAKGQEQKERHQLQKALSMSALEQEQQEEEDAKLLERALSLSVQEGAPLPNENLEEELQRALEASQKEEEENRREEERLFQRALSMSVDEDDELQAALEASMKEMNDSQLLYQHPMYLD